MRLLALPRLGRMRSGFGREWLRKCLWLRGAATVPIPHIRKAGAGARCGCCALIRTSPHEFGTTGAGGKRSAPGHGSIPRGSCLPGENGQLRSRKSSWRSVARRSMVHGSMQDSSWGFHRSGESPFPAPGSSTCGVNALPGPRRCGAGACSAGPIVGADGRIRAGFGGAFSAPLLPLQGLELVGAFAEEEEPGQPCLPFPPGSAGSCSPCRAPCVVWARSWMKILVLLPTWQ